MAGRTKILMRYYITSGSVREGRDCYISPERVKIKRGKRSGRGSVATQLERNRKEAYKRLARIINCNYGPGDLWLQLMYKVGKEPQVAEARRDGSKFIERVGREYFKKYKRKLVYAWVVGEYNPRNGAKVPVHHHLVLPADAWEIVQRHWPLAHLAYKPLDGRHDYTGIARYMVGNSGASAGGKKWSTSRGMKKPDYSSPVPVLKVGSFKIPKNAVVQEREIFEDSETGCKSGYIRYIVPQMEDKEPEMG